MFADVDRWLVVPFWALAFGCSAPKPGDVLPELDSHDSGNHEGGLDGEPEVGDEAVDAPAHDADAMPAGDEQDADGRDSADAADGSDADGRDSADAADGSDADVGAESGPCASGCSTPGALRCAGRSSVEICSNTPSCPGWLHAVDCQPAQR